METTRTFDLTNNRGEATVNLHESWYVLIGKGATVHGVEFRRFKGQLTFLKKLGKLGLTPYQHDQITLIQKV